MLGRTHKTLEMVAEVLRIPHRLHRNLLINEERSVSGNILKQLLMLTFNPRNILLGILLILISIIV